MNKAKTTSKKEIGTKTGIWMDKRTANLITLKSGSVVLQNIRSHIEEFRPKGGSGTRLKGGPQDVVQDSKYTEREKHQINAYFKKIIEQLPNSERLVIFGPAQIGKKFADLLMVHHTTKHLKIITVEVADSMTENQRVAWVKNYFGKKFD